MNLLFYYQFAHILFVSLLFYFIVGIDAEVVFLPTSKIMF